MSLMYVPADAISALRCVICASCMWLSIVSVPPSIRSYLPRISSRVMTTHTPSVSNCGRPARPAICITSIREYSS